MPATLAVQSWKFWESQSEHRPSGSFRGLAAGRPTILTEVYLDVNHESGPVKTGRFGRRSREMGRDSTAEPEFG
jgi:hypothetical protein